MAMASFAKDLNKELTCTICLDLYKSPKMLPCLHTFCKNCLEGVVKANDKPISMSISVLLISCNLLYTVNIHFVPDTIVCPTSRTQHNVPSEDVDEFSTNFIAANLVELLSFHGESNLSSAGIHKCENEIDDNPAASKCIDCDFYLCENCTVLHEKQRATKKHILVSIAEIKSGSVKQLSKKRYCSEHEGEELKLYCSTCQKVICRDCTIVTHKQHEYTFIKDVTEELKKKLQDLSATVTNKEKAMCDVVDHINREKKEEVQKLFSYNQRAKLFFEKLISEDQERIVALQKYVKQLQSHKTALYKEICSASSSHLKQLTAQEEEFQFSSVRISSALNFSQQLLSSPSTTDLAMMSQQVCQQFQTLKKLPSDKSLVKKSPWTVSLSEQDPLKSKVMPNGQVAHPSSQILPPSQVSVNRRQVPQPQSHPSQLSVNRVHLPSSAPQANQTSHVHTVPGVMTQRKIAPVVFSCTSGHQVPTHTIGSKMSGFMKPKS